MVNLAAGSSGDGLDYDSGSLVLEFGEFTCETTGDAEEDVEDRMVDQSRDNLDGTVYRAGHHGSSLLSTQLFLNAVDPDIAVVSSD
ncbi:hypothetical protein GCM10009647_052180 [Streptomyces sanglieri]